MRAVAAPFVLAVCAIVLAFALVVHPIARRVNVRR